MLLERLGLADKRNAWFMTLSGGQKQRLFIALALIHDPEVVLLDELTTGLDPQARRAIWEMVRGIRERGKTVLLTTHLMEEAERLCDRVAIIERGRVIAAAAHFASIPGLESVQQQGRRWTLRGRSDDLVTDIIDCISEHRMRVTEFRTELANLEDVFLKLTGHSIRD